MKVNSISPSPVSRVRELLEKRSKRGEELGYEQQNALEHGEEFADGESKQVSSLASKLMKEFPSLNEESAMKLAELRPSDPALLRMVVADSELSDEEVQKILSALKG